MTRWQQEEREAERESNEARRERRRELEARFVPHNPTFGDYMMTRTFTEIMENADNVCSSDDLSELQIAHKKCGFLAQVILQLEENNLRLERENAAQRTEANDVLHH